MSQIQSEVRPRVLQMPQSGFLLQTGGSARKRVIKPTQKQESTTSFPIQTHYKVSGVPGHTHNASAVLSVLCDLKRNRGVALTSAAGNWSEEEMKMAAAEPGDSFPIEDEDERLERALERGIGELCLRPENCHQEIREPVRSISEIRTLVAPDDRLQTLTYVEEVGGFVNPDGKPYISDYPDVYVSILGLNDSSRRRYENGDDVGENDIKGHCRLEHAEDWAGTVLISRTDGSDRVGTLEDGSPFNGTIRFRWDAKDFVYRSEGFQVTLTGAQEIRRLTDVDDQGRAIDSEIADIASLRIYVKPIVTTRASNGSCFLCSEELTNDQCFTSSYGHGIMPEFAVDLLDALPSGALRKYVLKGCPGVRIKVGGNHAIYGPAEQGTNFVQRLANAKPVNTVALFSEASRPSNLDFADANPFLFDDYLQKFGEYGERI